MTPIQDLQELRRTVKPSVCEDGIFLVARFRYEASAKWVIQTVKAMGGTALICKTGKTEYSNYRASKTWRVAFTVGIEADQYLTGRINLRGYHEMVAFEAERLTRKAEQAQQSQS